MEELLNLEHADRQRFIEEISAINRRMNESSAPAPKPASRGISLQEWAGLI